MLQYDTVGYYNGIDLSDNFNINIGVWPTNLPTILKLNI